MAKLTFLTAGLALALGISSSALAARTPPRDSQQVCERQCDDNYGLEISMCVDRLNNAEYVWCAGLAHR